MAREWATSSVDLHLEIAGAGLRAGLETALREAVRTGRLAPGARLPSSRALAADLGIARNTVADAYGQLVAEGWLVARQGSGTRVADRAQPPAESNSAQRGVQGGPFPRGGADGGSSPAAGRAPRHDLRAGSPDLSRFPRSAWLAAARRALNRVPDAGLGYGDPRGRPELREALAGYLARARGVRVSPDRIVVCSGFTQGLALLARVLRRGTLAVEAYSQPSHREVAAAGGLDLLPLSVDGGGADLDGLGGAGAALLTAAHQFPLGVPLSPARRSRAVEWAQATGGLLIEDDYDGEFRYDRQPVGAMQALAPEHVVYAGTASKTLAPGLRLGWLAAPARLVDDLVAAKELADRQTGALDQLTLAELIASGAYDRHVRRSRLAYRRRRDRLVAVLAAEAPRVRVTGIAAGLHALVRIDGDERDAVARAAEHGVAVEGLAEYLAGGARAGNDRGAGGAGAGNDRGAGGAGAGHDRAADGPGHGPALVVGYGTPPDHAFTASIARLAAALR